ncbi:MAG: hypothetical protein BRD55_04790 [Bacteroidetes bacterium SW_9_63_38]|nr:MAG: hypothetical protein BRD55_04790 [Bacteroidetes bacterium SW_9_63_38]
MSSPLLATYGTLMRGFDIQDELGVRPQMDFVERCRWEGELYDIGPFPGAVPGDGTIHGELFRLDSPDAWAVLDPYEGYDPDWPAASTFVRREVSLSTPDTTAWVYWYNGTVADQPQVASGDWGKHVG